MDKNKSPSDDTSNPENKNTPDDLVHNWDSITMKKNIILIPIIIAVVVILGGVGMGLFLAKQKSAGSLTSLTSSSGSTSTSGKKVVGSSDTSTFKDMAEGTLQKGGIDGEGTHKLIRPGGDSQTVYIISTILDLDQFTGKKIRVWGQTHSAKTAGWLMDVGRVEVL